LKKKVGIIQENRVFLHSQSLEDKKKAKDLEKQVGNLRDKVRELESQLT